MYVYVGICASQCVHFLYDTTHSDQQQNNMYEFTKVQKISGKKFNLKMKYTFWNLLNCFLDGANDS